MTSGRELPGESLSKLLEHVPGLLVIADDALRVVWSSRGRWEATKACELKPAFGRPVEELIHSFDLDSLKDAIAHLDEQQQNTTRTLRVRAPAPATAPPLLELQISHWNPHGDDVKGYVLAFARCDFGDLQEAARERQFGAIFRALEEGVAMIDREGKVLRANYRATELLGIREGMILDEDQPKSDVLLRDSRGKPLCKDELPVQRTLRYGTALSHVELCRHLEDGEVVWLLCNTQPLRTVSADQQVEGVVLSVREMTRFKEAEAQLRKLAYYDPLTGVANRKLFMDRLEQAMRQARRHEHPCALLYMDLDRFKRINDSYGHSFGDQLLQVVADRIASSLREGDTLARLGGDEFTVLLTRMEDVRDAEPVVQRLNEVLKPPVEIEGEEFVMNASIGVAVFPRDGVTPEEMLSRADHAMYAAKQSQDTNFMSAEGLPATYTSDRLRLERELEIAVEREEFLLYYQPKMSLATGRMQGLEALVRWQHPTRGIISPGQFIPVAEEMGLIAAIGEWVLHEACQQLTRWRENGLPLVQMSVNVSSSQLQQDGFVNLVGAALEEHRLPGSALELELTESMVVRRPDRALAVFRALADLGITLALDDFGTGFSSLAMLTGLPFSTLKVDRSFVQRLDNSEDTAAEAMVNAIIMVGRSLNMQIVAEGVERQSQLERLRALGADYVQGFLYGYPADADSIAHQVRCLA